MQGQNPNLTELQAIRDEITGLRQDLKKLNLVGAVSQGVFLGTIALVVLGAILQLFLMIFA